MIDEAAGSTSDEGVTMTITAHDQLANPMESSNWVDGVPFDIFAALRREEKPVRMIGPRGTPYWALVHHADVVAASRSPEIFSNEPDPFTVGGAEPEGEAPMRIPLLISLDAPAHTQRRQLINKGFTPRRVTRLQSTIDEIVAEHLTKVKDSKQFDFVTDLAVELPLQVIAELLGIPKEDRARVFGWTEQMMSGDDSEFDNNPEEVMAALGAMYGYSEDLCQRRRETPGEDLMSVLLDAEVAGERLDQMDLNLFFMLLHNAGSETTRNLVTGGILALLQNPDQLARLQQDPSLVPVAVEEMLRWVTPVTHFARTATSDTEIGGQAIAAGEQVLLWYISANRDEAVFADPDRFDVTRDPNPHVAFGSGGPHFCLGAHLARLEAITLFEALLPHVSNLELAGPVERLQSHFISGIKHLPLRWSS
jgi:cholest-4-en-3-one 26-monooxygenase